MTLNEQKTHPALGGSIIFHLRECVLPPVFVSAQQQMRGAVSQTDASEDSRHAADAHHRLARLEAVDVDLERDKNTRCKAHTQKFSLNLIHGVVTASDYGLYITRQVVIRKYCNEL